MRLGVFADLHSNVYALRVMLHSGSDVDAWLSVGDAVGLFPPANEVLDELRRKQVIAVRGDHEECLVSGGRLPGSFTGNDSLDRQRATLTDENLKYVRDLPRAASLVLGERRVQMVHALTEGCPEPAAKYSFDIVAINERWAGHGIVVSGHTHLPLVCYSCDTLIVNPGSSGFPVDVTRHPSYAVVDTETLWCELRRFDYDKEPLIEDIRRFGYNPALSRFLRTGRWGG